MPNFTFFSLAAASSITPQTRMSGMTLTSITRTQEVVALVSKDINTSKMTDEIKINYLRVADVSFPFACFGLFLCRKVGCDAAAQT